MGDYRHAENTESLPLPVALGENGGYAQGGTSHWKVRRDLPFCWAVPSHGRGSSPAVVNCWNGDNAQGGTSHWKVRRDLPFCWAVR